MRLLRLARSASHPWVLATNILINILIMVPVAARAQIVQLPQLHSFSNSGTVLVPDGGTALVGGVGYSAQGASRSGMGPLSNRALADMTSGSTISASVQIIDLEALDQAILASATPRTAPLAQPLPGSPPQALPANSPDKSGTAVTAAGTQQRSRLDRLADDQASAQTLSTTKRAATDPGKWQRVLSGGGTPPVLNVSLVESNVRYYVELGEQAERSGSVQAARVYYRMARQAMTPELVAHYEIALRQRAAEEAARKTGEQAQENRKF